MRYRKVRCPEPLPSAFSYRCKNKATGEVLESRDLAPLLVSIAYSMVDYYDFLEKGGMWTIEVIGRS